MSRYYEATHVAPLILRGVAFATRSGDHTAMRLLRRAGWRCCLGPAMPARRLRGPVGGCRSMTSSEQPPTQSLPVADEPSVPLEPPHIPAASRSYHSDTLLVHGGISPDLYGPYTPSSVPLYQTATFASPSATSTGLYDYTRSGNPTRAALQQQLAHCEGSQHAYVFTSGMAALTIVTQLLRSGEGVLGSDDMYGGTVRLLTRVLDHNDHPVHFCDHTSLAQVEAQLQKHPHIKLIMVSRTADTQRSGQQVKVVASVCRLTEMFRCACGAVFCQTETPTNPLMRSVSQTTEPYCLLLDCKSAPRTSRLTNSAVLRHTAASLLTA